MSAPMEEFKVAKGKVKEKLKELIREGNVRRVIIRNSKGRTLLDMPLSAGMMGALLLPFWAAVGGILLMATEFTIALKATRAVSSSGRPDPTNIISVWFSMRGMGVRLPLISVTSSSTFIAPSMAVPIISP